MRGLSIIVLSQKYVLSKRILARWQRRKLKQSVSSLAQQLPWQSLSNNFFFHSRVLWIKAYDIQEMAGMVNYTLLQFIWALSRVKVPFSYHATPWQSCVRIPAAACAHHLRLKVSRDDPFFYHQGLDLWPWTDTTSDPIGRAYCNYKTLF